MCMDSLSLWHSRLDRSTSLPPLHLRQEEAREVQFIRKKDKDNLQGLFDKMQAAEQNQVRCHIRSVGGMREPAL